MTRTNAAFLLTALALVAMALPAASQSGRAGESGGAPPLQRLQTMTARFAPVPLGADVAALPASEQKAVEKLVEAARVMDALFLQQVWAGNTPLLVSLSRDESPLGRARLRYFLVNKGPWSRLDEDAAFVPGVGPKPEGANFYPPDATKEQVEAWMQGLPPAEKAAAQGFFTTIRRGPDGQLRSVPYSTEYQGELGRAALLLREAAAATTQPTLKAYLDKRAAAFISNDYYDSDVAWMELDSSIEPTIGPYEVYEDEWFGYKAAFEAYVTLRDDAETAKLAKLGGELQELENALPIEPSLRNPKLGALSPIRVVNIVFGAGDANAGVNTAAFNLPNDERVAREKGAKRTMLKNVQEAKFQKVLLPVAALALPAADRRHVSFEAFFTHILMHELMHGLGPHGITVDGRATTVRQELREQASALEEAKADVSGLWALQRLVDKGVLDRSLERTMYTTFLASAFRSIRFGLDEAHGRGIALQLNAFLDAGAFVVSPDGTFRVDPAKIKEAVRDLTGRIMTLQARGDRAGAAELLQRMAVVRPPVRRVLDRLARVPVDIEPRYVVEQPPAQASPPPAAGK